MKIKKVFKTVLGISVLSLLLTGCGAEEAKTIHLDPAKKQVQKVGSTSEVFLNDVKERTLTVHYVEHPMELDISVFQQNQMSFEKETPRKSLILIKNDSEKPLTIALDYHFESEQELTAEAIMSYYHIDSNYNISNTWGTEHAVGNNLDDVNRYLNGNTRRIGEASQVIFPGEEMVVTVDFIVKSTDDDIVDIDANAKLRVEEPSEQVLAELKEKAYTIY